MNYVYLHAGVVGALAVLFGLTGAGLLHRAFRGATTRLHPAAFWAMAVLIGMAVGVIGVRVLAPVAGARAAVFLTLAGCAAAAGWAAVGLRGQGLFPRPWVYPLVPAVCVALAVPAFTYYACFRPAPIPLDSQDLWVQAHWGTAHSARYVGVTELIRTTNRVPFIRQNYFQSLVVLFDASLGQNPYLGLVLWTAVCRVALGFLAFGIFRQLGVVGWLAGVGSALYLFGNVGLSLLRVHATDAGMPFTFIGYVDVLYGIASLVGAFWLLVAYLRDPAIHAGWLGGCILAVTAAWAMAAPQNVALAGAVLAVVGIPLLAMHRRVRGGAVIAALFLTGAGGGAALGGMLMPRSWAEPVRLPGVMDAPSKVGVHWGHWFIAGVHVEHLYNPSFHQRGLDHAMPTSIRQVENIAYAEARLWEAIRPFFFPIVGLAVLPFLLARHPQAESIAPLMVYSRFGLGLLVLGMGITSLLSFGGYKWEVTRFAYPAFGVGLLCYVGFLLFLLANTRSYTGRAALVVLGVGLPMFGPVRDVYERYPLALCPPKAVGIPSAGERLKFLTWLQYPPEVLAKAVAVSEGESPPPHVPPR